MMRRALLKRLRPWLGTAAALCLAATALQLAARAGGSWSFTQDPWLDGTGPAVAAATGFFHLAELDNHWMLITPAGRPFWMRAVYAVNWTDGGPAAAAAFQTRYHGDQIAFARHAVERLKAWGFNTIADYSSPYVLPVPTYFRPQGNSEKLPFIRGLNISWYGSINDGHLAPEAFKTLLAGAVDPSVYHGWPGHVPDVFDPNFAIYARALAADKATPGHPTVFTEKTATGGAPQPSLVNSPWLLATIPDDSDYLYGFGPGPEIPGRDDVIHPNIGWIVAVTRPTQTENDQVGAANGNRHTVHYSDPTVYAKVAWADFLQKRYGSLTALNAAWGSNYTTFGSDGGWPNGRGLLDESGRHAWIGNDPLRLSQTAPAVRRDMNAFLAVYADQYFRIVSEAIHAATPHQLIFSGVLDESGGLTRVQVLSAAARYCDALQLDTDSSLPQVLPTTFAVTGKPLFAWIGIRADADSPLGGTWLRRPEGFPTQAQRGAAYAQTVDSLFAARADDDVAPMIGFAWWEYMDKPSEHADWGLVTSDDNGYDGQADTVQPGRDAWGFATGGEAANYGDFLSAVTRANEGVDRMLLAGVTKRTRGGPNALP